jgi:hypothetical protein
MRTRGVTAFERRVAKQFATGGFKSGFRVHQPYTQTTHPQPMLHTKAHKPIKHKKLIPNPLSPTPRFNAVSFVME